MKLFKLLNRAGLNLFFFLLIGVVFLSWLFPFYGTEESPLPVKQVVDYGVSVIFFFYGLKLSWSTLVKGLSNYKLHIVIQCTTFILFPAAMVALWHTIPHGDYEKWWIGAFYLAVLPSTVSSSVVLVSIAGGNIPAAIFNASISSLIGIFVTPLWMSFFLPGPAGQTSDLASVIIHLCMQVLFPVLIGMALNHKLGNFALRHKDQLRNFDQFIILLIVYRAFSESFSGHMFDGYLAIEIISLGILMMLMFVIMALIINQISLWMKFRKEDRITIIFCGSKKSLVQGAVMGQVLFSNPVTFGVVLLPLMLYHALQLLAGSVLAQWFANNEKG